MDEERNDYKKKEGKKLRNIERERNENQLKEHRKGNIEKRTQVKRKRNKLRNTERKKGMETNSRNNVKKKQK